MLLLGWILDDAGGDDGEDIADDGARLLLGAREDDGDGLAAGLLTTDDGLLGGELNPDDTNDDDELMGADELLGAGLDIALDGLLAAELGALLALDSDEETTTARR
jgi:hypothetical protein